MSDYELTGTKWGAAEAGSPGGEVVWSLAETAGRYLDFDRYIGEGAVADVIGRAFDAWESVADIDFGEVADSPESDIRLGLSDIDGAYDTIGRASWSYAPRSGDFDATRAAEIAFDTAENWSLDGARAADEVDLYATALHEIGHAIGLSHNPAADTIMYHAQQPDILALTWDDVAGAQAIYGPSAAEASDNALRVAGTDGNDRLDLVPGTERVDGGGGFDTLLAPGDRSEYGYDIDAARHVVLTSRATGEITFLDDVERIRFDDGEVRPRPDEGDPVMASHAMAQGAELAYLAGSATQAEPGQAGAPGPAETAPADDPEQIGAPVGVAPETDHGFWLG